MKPDKPFRWAYGADAVKIDPTGKEENGYTKEILPYAYLNAHLNKIGEWTEYLDRFVKTYYVQCTSGNDSTGDGSVTYPFKTIKKACDSIENGGYGTIRLDEAGDYEITADIDLINKHILIYENTAINVNILHKNYVSSGNKYYAFNLYMSSSISIFADTITMEDVDTGEASGDDYAIGSFSGNNNISVFTSATAGHGIIFTTSSPASGTPSYIKNIISSQYTCFTSVQITARITTGTKGYVIDSAGLPMVVYGYAGLIDNSDYWWADYRIYQFTTGKAFDGSDTTFVFGGNGWDTGTGLYGSTEHTIDISNTVQDYFDEVYGSGAYTATGSGVGNYVIRAKGTVYPETIRFKHENTSGQTTTYGICRPVKLDKNIITNL